VPPTNVMNSRRRMYGPIVSVQSVNKKRHVRYGPKADISIRGCRHYYSHTSYSRRFEKLNDHHHLRVHERRRI
jgi:hypothetical protein